MTQSQTVSSTYSRSDITDIVNRVRADLTMIAECTGAWTAEYTQEIIHDIEYLAQGGYLRQFDLTLLSGKKEIKATRYVVNTEAGSLSMSRPGGVMWPIVERAKLRVVLSYYNTFDAVAREKSRKKLKRSWSPTSADTTHSTLSMKGGRDYASKGYGMQRSDWSS